MAARKDLIFSLRLDEETRARLDELAAALHEPPSEIVRRAINALYIGTSGEIQIGDLLLTEVKKKKLAEDIARRTIEAMEDQFGTQRTEDLIRDAKRRIDTED